MDEDEAMVYNMTVVDDGPFEVDEDNIMLVNGLVVLILRTRYLPT